jgi:tetratricopeptide (TPR) repeat protein
VDAARLPAPATLDDLVALFETGDATRFQATVRRSRALRQWIEDYQAAETPWPAHPRKDAIFALALATAGLHAGDEDTRNAAGAAMVARSRLVRQPLGADPFECAWYRAAVSAATSVYLADAVLSGTEQAIARCPVDGRLHLARALARDQLWSIDDARRRSPESAVADLDLTAVLREYEEVARGFPDVAAEAHLRAAWAAYRAKDTARALALLAGVPARGPDPVLDYFGHLIRAQVLRRAERTDDAVAAYRDALRVWPGAQSARVGLMTLLVQRGEREESERLSEAVETAPLDQIDPWWVYWQGDYRSFTRQIQQLQEMAR